MARVVMAPGWRGKVRAAWQPAILDITSQILTDVLVDVGTNHYVTGDLFRSVRQEYNKVFIGTDHWHFIEYGTDPHVITPSTKQALYWEGAPHPVKRVNHPGTPEYGPMRRALYKKRGLRGAR